MSANQTTKICCGDFKDAIEDGTDNEGYGPLIRLSSGEFRIGSEHLAAMAYCPWCGANIKETNNAE